MLLKEWVKEKLEAFHQYRAPMYLPDKYLLSQDNIFVVLWLLGDLQICGPWENISI